MTSGKQSKIESFRKMVPISTRYCTISANGKVDITTVQYSLACFILQCAHIRQALAIKAIMTELLFEIDLHYDGPKVQLYLYTRVVLSHIIRSYIGLPVCARSIERVIIICDLRLTLEDLDRETLGSMPCDVAVHEPSLSYCLVRKLTNYGQGQEEKLTPGLFVLKAMTR